MLRALLQPSTRRLIAFLLALVVANLAFADEHHPLWMVHGKHNKVYLLGSIHLLPASEALPAVTEEAYRDAEKIVMEIDLDDLDPGAAQKLTMELGVFPPGQTLAAQLGPEAAAKVDADAKRLGVSMAMLDQFRPWLAAITLTQLHLFKLGLDPQAGVEQRFLAKATADHKEILGLETLEQQFKLLADLPPKLQADFLLQSIKDADDAEHEVDEMISAWRSGDVVALEKFVTRGMKEFPELYAPLTVDRNKRWIKRLEEILNDKDDYLVIVGALHLVGKDGVLDLLSKKGYKIEQR
jgi:uncharacterized protein YbaP (TraB family)